ncbi:TM2 domain-containing protein [Paenibacillus thailandensis]|uniref:TM2 domain-containing protein n=1 Tax=Paenibacillus thailandensis TaxID=393250 RepID=A0ABW5R5U2_9BACL
MEFNIGQKSQLDARELLLLDQEVKHRGKNMVIAYVLWYFLGILGGHRFYMGRIGSAVAQLILSLTVIGLIVTSIWWIVDAFLLHTMVKDKNREVEQQVLHEIFINRPPAPNSF